MSDNIEKENELTEPIAIGYFSYENREMAYMAERERDKISKLEKQLNYSNPSVVYNLYNKIIEGHIFHTPEGMMYLLHLQDYLDSKEGELPGPVMPVPSEQFIGLYNGDGEAETEEEIARLKGKVRELETLRNHAFKNMDIKRKKTEGAIYKLIIAALVLVIIVMFVITALSDSPNIVNYRYTIQNEYAEWEQKLKDKEDELNQREKALEENTLKDKASENTDL